MRIEIWYRTGFIIMALGVVLGAFGAHTLKVLLSPSSLQAWQTAVLYHFVHGLGLLFILKYAHQSAYMLWTARLLLVGLFCFSGSLYLLACKDLIPFSIAWIGPITPIGGVAWIAAWICAAIGAKSIATQ